MAVPRHTGRTRTQRQRELHVCIDCHGHLVYPIHWEEAGPEHWSVTLRCPSCEWTELDVFHQDLVDVFDEELDRGTQALVHDLRELVQANMAEEIDRFSLALRADAILPEDF